MKFLHIADIHLGMENYGRIDPSTGLHTRLKDFIKCFSYAMDIALEEKVDLVILPVMLTKIVILIPPISVNSPGRFIG